MNILFVTWDGPGSIYLETLFSPIFERLRGDGLHFDVLQFTWADNAEVSTRFAACHELGIRYRAVSIWRWGGAAGPFLSAFRGRRLVREAAVRWRSDALMPRSIMPALATLHVSGRLSLPMIFDADGLMADERVDFAGLSRSSISYRLLRRIEAAAVRQSEIVLVRTTAGARILQERAGANAKEIDFAVVRNGRDPCLYHPCSSEVREETRRAFGISSNAPLIVYCGSLGRKYGLPKMLDFFDAVLRRRKGAKFLILTPSVAECKAKVQNLRPELASEVFIVSATPALVPPYVAASDLGLVFIVSALSMLAASPIKLGEYLLCGVPVAGTTACGGTAPIFAAQQGGDVGDMSKQALERTAAWFLDRVMSNRDAFRDLARREGMARYSLTTAVEGYRSAIRSKFPPKL